MKIKAGFVDEDFMLTTSAARRLYHENAEQLPIVDYHCHLSPKMIAENHSFRSITEAWLEGDHYKWRAMRANGVTEEYITGNKSDKEKFLKWAETVPYTMRNPLYHWTHLELSRIFGVNELLNPRTACRIYEECNEKLLQEDFQVQGLIARSGVEVLCTTDDPIDSLDYHRQIRESGFTVKVLPAWRPDKVLALDDPQVYKAYIDQLAEVADMEITCYGDLLSALAVRHTFFAKMGCKLSDHSIDTFYAVDYHPTELVQIFDKIMCGNHLTTEDKSKLKSGLLHELAIMDAEKGWVQQYHLGAIRNNSTKRFHSIGADAGCDGINDLCYAASGHHFFDDLDAIDKLAKTIVYNLNPKDNEVLAAMAYTFNDGKVKGKMQWGAAWWFLDNEQGIRRHLDTLSSQGLLSQFVGMLTDSRSFLSFPRHEYFRRILCDVIGRDVEYGKLPKEEMAFITQMVSNISYYNAKDYFQF